MASLNNFDANTVEPSKPREPMPVAWYKMAITNSDKKPNSKNTGSYIALELAVLEGEHKGRKAFVNLNLDNPNAQAVAIARSELSAICRAINVMTPNDTAELHNKPLWVYVAMEKRKDTGEMQNRVKEYKSLADGNAVAAAPQAAGANGGKPW